MLYGTVGFNLINYGDVKVDDLNIVNMIEVNCECNYYDDGNDSGLN